MAPKTRALSAAGRRLQDAKPASVKRAASTRGQARADASLAAGGAQAYGNGYEAARLGRRLRGWNAERRTINALLQAGGEQLRARSRQLCRENPYAANACEAYASAAVGAGVVPSSLLTDAPKKDAIQKAWNAWIEEADADGITDFYGLQALAARAQFEAGECFIRFRPRRLTDGLTVPLQLQLLESEMLPYSKNETAANGNNIREGIEFDGIGRRVAYHFYTSHPGETYPLIFDFQTTRVPASEVLHLYKPLRPGQIRGQPQCTPSMVRLYLLDLYDDAELDRKRVAAMFAGFITKKSPENEQPLPTLNDLPVSDSPLAVTDEATSLAPLEPGSMQVLMEGEDVKFSSPSEVGGSYEAFMWRNILAIAAGLGVPYTDMTGDTSKSNYSSSRESQVQYRRRIDQFQHLVLVHQMCRPIWKRWFETAVLSGAIPITTREFAADPRGLMLTKWIPPKWDWVDPWKDRKALQLAIEMGIVSRYDAIEMEGEDPVDTDRRIKLAQDSEIAGPLHFRPVAERLNVNIAAEADDPDAAVDAVESRGEVPPAAAPKAMTRKRLEAKAVARAKREDPLFAAHLAELDAIERGGAAH